MAAGLLAADKRITDEYLDDSAQGANGEYIAGSRVVAVATGRKKMLKYIRLIG